MTVRSAQIESSEVTNFSCVPDLRNQIYGVEFSAPRVYKYTSNKKLAPKHRAMASAFSGKL